MPDEPAIKRCIAYIDGQNLFHCAKSAFGHSYPNYDPRKLAQLCCTAQGWDLAQCRFYTGIHSPEVNPKWHRFWQLKLANLGRTKVVCTTLPLRYSEEQVIMNDGSKATVSIPREKGIDIRIALNLISGALNSFYDVALIFSQDQDYAEAVKEMRELSITQKRWIRLASAYPEHPNGRSRGIDRTQFIPIPQADYESCLDDFDYMSKLIGY